MVMKQTAQKRTPGLDIWVLSLPPRGVRLLSSLLLFLGILVSSLSPGWPLPLPGLPSHVIGTLELILVHRACQPQLAMTSRLCTHNSQPRLFNSYCRRQENLIGSALDCLSSYLWQGQRQGRLAQIMAS